MTRVLRRRVALLESRHAVEELTAEEALALVGPPGGKEWTGALLKVARLAGGFSALVEMASERRRHMVEA